MDMPGPFVAASVAIVVLWGLYQRAGSVRGFDARTLVR